VLVHLDTDFAGDTDDAAALAMLLGWPDADVVGITTTADPDGSRAGYVQYLLGLAGRDDIPVAAGAGASLGGAPMGGLPDHEAFWGDAAVVARPSPAGAAVDLIAAGVERGATVVAIGPYTNLARLETARPGILGAARVVLMGGWVFPAADGLPQWGPERDWNVQCDTAATQQVFAAADDLTLATLTATLRAHLRAADLERLEASGPIGRLLARQGRAHSTEHRLTELGRAYPSLPDDLLNFQYDPVACAVALGWPGATTATVHLRPALDAGVLRFEPVDTGMPVTVVLDVDGTDFADTWLRAIERADSRI
jgi:purine nucleosidase